MTTCCFNADTSHAARMPIPCGEKATHAVTDRRPLPDGAQRKPMPSCEHHALALMAASPTAYVVTFKLWATR